MPTALSRFRFNVAVTANKHLAFQANLQDARVAGKEVGPTTAPFRGPFDLRTAFADVGDAKAPIAVRLGRQELVYGESRLLGSLPWVNTGRSWDAAKVILRSPLFQVDLFGASLVRSLPNEFDKSGNGNRLAGAYATSTKLLPKATVEPYVFWRRDVNIRSELGALGTLSQTTIGTRVAGQLPARLDYGVEMALQRGGLDEDSLNAWAGHWQVRASLPGWASPKVTSEYNFATGDDVANDGTRQTFDQLYPTGARQAGARRSDRLAQHPPPARRRRDHADQGDSDLAELSLLVAGERHRRPLLRERRTARPACRRWSGEHARRSGDSICR